MIILLISLKLLMSGSEKKKHLFSLYLLNYVKDRKDASYNLNEL